MLFQNQICCFSCHLLDCSIFWGGLCVYQRTKIDWSKLKVFAEEKINVTEKLKFVLRRIENSMGKGENAGYHYFLLFPQCLEKDSCFKVVKSSNCAVKV